MTIMQQFMELVVYRITEGSVFCWKCFGNNAYRLNSWDGNQDGATVSILFDTRTQETYQLEACDYKNNRAYRWLNPEYKQAHNEEASIQAPGRENQAWDDVNFVDLETVDDFFTKAAAILSGEKYDERVSIPIKFSDQDLLTYMKMAHEMDITFNQFVEQAILALINSDKDLTVESDERI